MKLSVFCWSTSFVHTYIVFASTSLWPGLGPGQSLSTVLLSIHGSFFVQLPLCVNHVNIVVLLVAHQPHKKKTTKISATNFTIRHSWMMLVSKSTRMAWMQATQKPFRIGFSARISHNNRNQNPDDVAKNKVVWESVLRTMATPFYISLSIPSILKNNKTRTMKKRTFLFSVGFIVFLEWIFVIISVGFARKCPNALNHFLNDDLVLLMAKYHSNYKWFSYVHSGVKNFARIVTEISERGYL